MVSRYTRSTCCSGYLGGKMGDTSQMVWKISLDLVIFLRVIIVIPRAIFCGNVRIGLLMEQVFWDKMTQSIRCGIVAIDTLKSKNIEFCQFHRCIVTVVLEVKTKHFKQCEQLMMATV